MNSASEIFAYEGSVEEVYRLLDKDTSAFSEMMNQLRADFEDTETLADELEEVLLASLSHHTPAFLLQEGV